MLQTAYIIQASDLELLISNVVDKKLLSFLPVIQDPDELITRKQTAKILGVSLPTLSYFVKSGKLVAYRVGVNVRFKRSEIETSLKKIDVS